MPRTYAIGCWGDGTFGHDHVRARLADLVKEFDEDLAKELLAPPTDDMSEEDDAIDILNTQLKGTDRSFGFCAGDLMCLTNEQWFREY